jgi:hypothetical protein
LVADLFEVVFLDPDIKASDVTTRRITRFSDTARRLQLTGVARPDEVFYDSRVIVVSH